MRKILVIETHFGTSGRSQRKIFFNIPDVGEKNFYRTITSFDAFFHSRHNRKNVTEHRQFTEHPFEDEDFYTKITEPDVNLNDFYEFLDYIGFNIETKKYRSGERIKKWDKKTSTWK